MYIIKNTASNLMSDNINNNNNINNNSPNNVNNNYIRRKRPIRRRFFRRFVYRRNRNNFNYRPINRRNNRIRRNNNNNKMNNKINEVIKKIDKISLNNKPLSDNKIYKSKEIRYDKMYNAIQMYTMSKYYPLYKSNMNTIFVPIYNSYTVETAREGMDIYYIWFPYLYPYLPAIKLDNQEVKEVTGMIFGTDDIQSYEPSVTTNIKGQYRLISASLKITNTSSMLKKGGSYTCYKVVNSNMYPYFSNGLANTYTELIEQTWDDMRKDYSSTPQKLLFNGTEIGYIDEFNINTGNNQFCNSDEYLGIRYQSDSVAKGGLPNDINPIGNNIVYKIKFDNITDYNTYKVQSWQIFEVAPSSDTNISSLATLHDKCATPEVIQQMAKYFPFHK